MSFNFWSHRYANAVSLFVVVYLLRSILVLEWTVPGSVFVVDTCYTIDVDIPLFLFDVSTELVILKTLDVRESVRYHKKKMRDGMP